MKYTYKTNINCGGCVARVTPALDSAAGIQAWQVDTANPDKLLTVETDTLVSADVMELVRQAGFQIEERKPAKRFGLF